VWRWLLRRADRVVTSGAAEAALCRRLGLAANRLVTVPPGFAPLPMADGQWTPGENPEAVVCLGPLTPDKGLRDAIWAFDILRHLYPELSLVLVGDGPDRPRLEAFARTQRIEDRVHFAGTQREVGPLLEGAAVVWVPSRADVGAHSALAAMAAGRPVVAAAQPGLAEVVGDGDTGLLVPPGDPVALARQTRALLDDPARRRRLGEAGRRRAAALFAAENLVRRFAGLYNDLAA
jgi:glycosyltransferase involved in cell wall biosynthesis